ncbi:MAG: outer membrane beta-barrel protein [Deltaproteobacteria bacterium]|jgi:opacity protein-like surface antigen|nr:outer membrane beta-barrel protein [Deltaproteobacteria bacterium]
MTLTVPQVGPVDLDFDVKSEIELQTILLNFWYDIPTGSKIIPYVGGGVGLGIIRVENATNFDPNLTDFEPIETYNSKTKTNFAFDIGGGIAYAVTDNFTLDLGYRFVWAGKVDVLNTPTIAQGGGTGNAIVVPVVSSHKKIVSHDVFLGGRYFF